MRNKTSTVKTSRIDPRLRSPGTISAGLDADCCYALDINVNPLFQVAPGQGRQIAASDQPDSFGQRDFFLLHFGFRGPLAIIVRVGLAVDFEVVVKLPDEREMVSPGPHTLRAAKFQRVSDLLDRKSVDHRETHFFRITSVCCGAELVTERLFVLDSLNSSFEDQQTLKFASKYLHLFRIIFFGYEPGQLPETRLFFGRHDWTC